MRTVVQVLASSLAFALMTATSGSQDEVAHFHNIVRARLERLREVHVEYRLRKEWLVRGDPRTTTAESERGVQVRRDDAPRELECVFTRSEMGVRFESRLTAEFVEQITTGETTIGDFPSETLVFTPEVHSHLFQRLPDGEWRGLIRDPQPIQSEFVIDWALGLRLIGGGTPWFTDASLEMATFRAAAEGRVECEITDERGVNHVWRFSPDAGWFLERYVVRGPEATYDSMVIDCLEPAHVNGLVLPMRVELARFRDIDDEVVMTQQSVAVLKSYELSLDDEARQACASIRWPEGARVHDTRTDVRSIANQDGELVPVDPPAGDKESLDETTNAVAFPPAGSGTASSDPADAAVNRRWLGVIALAVGVGAGLAAIVLASRRSGRRVAGALVLAVVCGQSADCIADPPSVDPPAADSPAGSETEPSALTPEQASLYASYVKSEERVARFRQSAVVAIHERVVRDLALSPEQAELCWAVLNDYVNTLAETSAEARGRLEMWDRTYWTERRQRERGVRQVEPPRPGDAGMRRVEAEAKDDGTTTVRMYPAEDDIYIRDRSQFIAFDQRDNVDPVRDAAAADIYRTIESLLTEEQCVRWDRAKRRLWIGLREGLTPRAGGRPNTHVDMLGLIDEACAPGAEWEHRSATFLFALDGAEVGSSTDSDSSLADTLAAFEVNYEAALRESAAAYDGVDQVRIDRVPFDDPAYERAGVRTREAMTVVWFLRRAFVRQLADVLRSERGAEATARWVDRYYQRSIPWHYESDAVDRLCVDRFGVEAVDAAADDALREDVRSLLARFVADRRRIRIDLSEHYIEYRIAAIETLTNWQARADLLHGEADELIARTITSLEAMLAR
jgi:hypothetical protein